MALNERNLFSRGSRGQKRKSEIKVSAGPLSLKPQGDTLFHGFLLISRVAGNPRQSLACMYINLCCHVPGPSSLCLSLSLCLLLSLIKTFSRKLEPTLIQYTRTSILTLNILAKTPFPNKSPFEVLDRHEFGEDTIHPATHAFYFSSHLSHFPGREAGLSLVCALSYLHSTLQTEALDKCLSSAF